jgi:Predicted membrane protein
MQDNVAGGLCYVLGLITGIIFLVLEPYNRNRAIRFHAYQSIFLNVAFIGLYIVLSIVSMVFGSVMPGVMGLLMIPVWLVLNLGGFVLWLVMIIKTIGGGKIVLPIIGPLAEKQA